MKEKSIYIVDKTRIEMIFPILIKPSLWNKKV